ncbi:MAG: serine protease [Dolichospermum sp.]
MRRFFTILIFSILLALLPVIAHALSYDQVSQIAKDTVVLIDGCTSGSGVIYERKGNVYSILTAKHVVSQPNGCFVITPDKVRQRINPNIIPVSGIDLAVVQFNSNKNYKLAEFGNSVALTPGKTVYVAGSPEPSVAIPQRTLLVTPGNIVGIQEPQNGYSLIYNNATRRGMSGGAVLNEEGKIVGIHGQGDEQDGSKVGLNLGIPIKLFLDSPVNAKKDPYENLTTEERKKRVETCNDWLGTSGWSFGKIWIVTRLLIQLFLGTSGWSLDKIWIVIRLLIHLFCCLVYYFTLKEGMGIKNQIICIMVILFLLEYVIFRSNKFIIIGFYTANIVLYTGGLYAHLLENDEDNLSRIIGLCLIIFFITELFNIPSADYIANTYCFPFGYSYY